MRALALALCLCSAVAAGWDGNALWEASTRADSPGGGGIWGTGGKGDYRITCSHCHVTNQGSVDLQLTFTPALGTVGTAKTYKPGQSYAVVVKLLGESRGRPYTACDQYMVHINGFALAVENAAGLRAGQYLTDSGLGSASCQPSVAATLTGTTLTYGRCHAVASNSAEDKTQWAFTWVAPAAGAGSLTVHWGVVDGNCDMNSLNDAVKEGKLVLAEGMAAAPGPGGAGWAALALGWLR